LARWTSTQARTILKLPPELLFGTGLLIASICPIASHISVHWPTCAMAHVAPARSSASARTRARRYNYRRYFELIRGSSRGWVHAVRENDEVADCAAPCGCHEAAACAEVKGQFLAIVSHERAPLNAIIGFPTCCCMRCSAPSRTRARGYVG
jgi:cell cycle sensor histidine kinase DivJ